MNPTEPNPDFEALLNPPRMTSNAVHTREKPGTGARRRVVAGSC